MKYRIDEDKCVRCYNCQSVCPRGAIHAFDTRLQITPQHCDGCGICAENCPVQAIEPVTQEVPVQQVNPSHQIEKEDKIYSRPVTTNLTPQQNAFEDVKNNLFNKWIPSVVDAITKEPNYKKRGRGRNRRYRKRRKW